MPFAFVDGVDWARGDTFWFHGKYANAVGILQSHGGQSWCWQSAGQGLLSGDEYAIVADGSAYVSLRVAWTSAVVGQQYVFRTQSVGGYPGADAPGLAVNSDYSFSLVAADGSTIVSTAAGLVAADEVPHQVECVFGPAWTALRLDGIERCRADWAGPGTITAIKLGPSGPNEHGGDLRWRDCVLYVGVSDYLVAAHQFPSVLCVEASAVGEKQDWPWDHEFVGHGLPTPASVFDAISTNDEDNSFIYTEDSRTDDAWQASTPKASTFRFVAPTSANVLGVAIQPVVENVARNSFTRLYFNRFNPLLRAPATPGATSLTDYPLPAYFHHTSGADEQIWFLYRHYGAFTETQPATGTAWDAASIAAAEWGVLQPSDEAGATQDALHCTRLYLEVIGGRIGAGRARAFWVD